MRSPAFILTILLFISFANASAQEAVQVRPTEWAQPVMGSELKNFYQITPELYRAAQPDDEDMENLATMGIKTVFNLRQFHSDKGEIKGVALHIEHLRLNAGHVTEADVIQAMKIIKNAPKPILLHCWHGSDRTGVMSAFYRLVFQDWTKPAALDEFIHGGYGYHSLYKNLSTLIEAADIDAIKKAVFAE